MKKIRQIAQKIELDKAVFLGILSKSWVFIAGPTSALFIASFFSAQLQGYYYTFATILALQVFVEMGLGTVTQQFASHEWSKLTLSKGCIIEGDADALSRLHSIAHISFRWFLNGSLIVIVGLSLGGYLFFATSSNGNISWKAPWLCLSIVAGINIFLVPFWSILEGCNQVKPLYAFRLVQGMVLNISVWIAIAGGAGLWSASLGNLMAIICAGIFIRRKYWKFFRKLFFTRPDEIGPKISWSKDMFPMQWRIAVSWISGYLSFSLFTPLLFKYQSAEIAGQFGMSWNIVMALGGLASTWLSPKIPLFAMLASKKNYKELDRLFWKIFKIVVFAIFTISLFAWIFIYMLPLVKISFATKFASRLVAPLPIAVLLLAQALVVATTPFSAYMRAHREEPMMLLSVLSGVLTAISTAILVRYSVLWVACGYLLVNVCVLPLIAIVWNKFRKRVIPRTGLFEESYQRDQSSIVINP